MTAQDVRRMLELLASIDGHLGRMEFAIASILRYMAEDPEGPQLEAVNWAEPPEANP